MSGTGKVDSTLLNENKKKIEVKASAARWIILFVFIWYSAINSFQWIEYSAINRMVVTYYNVSSLSVDWTSKIYMALYPFLVIPASYIIDKKGLRTAGLIGCIGTAIGTSIKVLSIGRDLFWVVMLGQSIVSASQLMILCLPTKIAAVWFKANEVSTACSFGVFGTQLGTAIGFIMPPIIVKYHEDILEIGANLNVLCWSLTASVIPVAVAVIFYFPNEPTFPPSIAQAEERRLKKVFTTSEFFNSVKLLFQNKGFNIHMVAYGISIGVFSAIGTLLTQIITFYFEGAEEEAGRMGFGMIITGMIGSIAFGIILDKTHKYKEITFLIYLLSSVSVVALMFSLELKSKMLTYISCGIVGLFTNAYMPVGFEMGIELTYPSEESTTSGILMALTQILGTVFTEALGHLNQLIGPFWSLTTQVVLLVIGTVITWFVPNDLRRQAAMRGGNPQISSENKNNFLPVSTEEKA